MAKKKKKKKVTKSRGSAKKKPAKKSAKPAKKRNSSVDALLRQFAKDRAQQESQLAQLQKKKQELQDKVGKLQQQISKLNEQESAAKSSLASLDQRRDQEVAALLSQLGVQLGAKDAPSDNRPKHEPKSDNNSAKPVLTLGRNALN